jgi:hypothetical protein
MSSTQGRNIADHLRDQGIVNGKDIGNMSAILHQASGGVVSGMNSPFAYEANKQNTNQQIYDTFVRGTLAKKRQSQYSERKAMKDKERFLLKHHMAVADLS